MIHNTKEHFNEIPENFRGTPSGLKFEAHFLVMKELYFSQVICSEWRVWANLLLAIDKEYGEIYPELKAHNILSEITNGDVNILGTSIMDDPCESRPDSVWEIIMAEKKNRLHWFAEENLGFLNILEKKYELDKSELAYRFISSTRTLKYLIQSLPLIGEISADTQRALSVAYTRWFHRNLGEDVML